jgi:uncharacterized integral membrane protein
MTFMTKLKLTLAVIGIILVTIIVLLNTNEVKLNFLIGKLTMPLAIMLALVFLLGMVVGLLFAYSFGKKKAKHS